MEIIGLNKENADLAAPLVAEFRVALKEFKGIVSKPDVAAGREEAVEYLRAGYPAFAAVESGEYIGYIVCRVDEPCVWVESLFVRPEYRRKGVASALFAKAEELAASYGEETVYNYVHPNNDGIIAFLKSRGYNVLNLIEVRKPYRDEALHTKMRVGEHEFNY